MSGPDPVAALNDSHQREALRLEKRYDEARERRRLIDEAYGELMSIINRQSFGDDSLPGAGCGLTFVEEEEHRRYEQLRTLETYAQRGADEADAEVSRALSALEDSEESYRKRLAALARQEQSRPSPSFGDRGGRW